MVGLMNHAQINDVTFSRKVCTTSIENGWRESHRREQIISMAYDARALANLLLDWAEDLRFPLTHMALHKILFYANGWFLAEHNMPLVKQPFEAWEHGPVLRSLYKAFKGAGKNPVADRASYFNPITNETSVLTADITPADSAFLCNILRAYGHVDALELSHMTHRKGSPWDQIWNSTTGRVSLGMTISDDLIRQDFLNQRSPLLSDIAISTSRA